jgi:dUTP pyrophosphatase
MGQLFVRSSLWRSGVALTAGVVDAGYEGVLGALLEVRNPAGVVLCRDAKLAQIVFHQLEGEVKGYDGIYNGAESILGLDGAGGEAVLNLKEV